MDIRPLIIIWCDVSFENDKCYQSMRDEFNETTTDTQKKPLDPIDMEIFNEGKEELRSNDVPLITVQTSDEAKREIKKHNDKKIFVICSGTVGRYLIPEIAAQFPYVHDVYIYAHNLALHVEWTDEYVRMVQMFDFHTNLLVRLTRDISKYFIQQGQMYMNIDVPQNALICFNHARNLEIAANVRDKMEPNPNDVNERFLQLQPDFRERLDLLEGDNGLIFQAENAVHEQEQPLETS